MGTTKQFFLQKNINIMSQLGSSTDDLSIPIENSNSLLRQLAMERQNRVQPNLKTFKYNDIEFKIEEIAGASLGSKVWESALALNQYFESFENEQKESISSSTRVLELGSGTGIVSIVFRKLFPNIETIIVSDKELQKKQIENNLKLNELENDDKIKFQFLDWSVDNSNFSPNEKRFDILIMSNVVSSDRSTFPLLRKTLCDLTAPGSKIYLSNQSAFEDSSVLQIALLQRSKTRETTPLQDFLTMMDEGFVVKNVVR